MKLAQILLEFNQSGPPCNRKYTYPDEDTARAALHDTRRNAKRHSYAGWTKQNLKRLSTYQCRFCGQWHLGKSPEHWADRHAQRARERSWRERQLAQA